MIVSEVREYWSSTLGGFSPRLFIIDITQLSGYDTAGFQLLKELYARGTRVAARTARSLAFLSEISSREHTGPALVYQALEKKKPVEETQDFQKPRAAAAGA